MSGERPQSRLRSIFKVSKKRSPSSLSSLLRALRPASEHEKAPAHERHSLPHNAPIPDAVQRSGQPLDVQAEEGVTTQHPISGGHRALVEHATLVTSEALPQVKIINKPQFQSTPSTPAIPSHVRCRLVIILDGNEHRPETEPELQWLDPDSYQELTAARDFGVSEAARSCIPVVQSASFINGDITLFQSDTISDKDKEVDHRPLLQEHDWKHIMPVMVAIFTGAHPYTHFYLEARWFFSSVLETTADKVTLRERIRQAMSHNWENEEYLSRSQLATLFSEDQVRELVYSDELLCQAMEQGGRKAKDDFVEKVLLVAVRLLAICIWIERPLTVLKTLLDQKPPLEDKDLPLKIKAKPEPLASSVFEHITLVQARFCVLDFDEEDADTDKYFEVPDHTTVPIFFKDPGDKLGNGAFGEVFKATIHSDHHRYPSVRSKSFALKRYIGGPTKRSDFIRERDVLRLLSHVPNENIVTHLFCWTHKQDFFMLFPMAKTNLKTYLSSTPALSVTKQSALWVLDQLVNLAEGVEHIHILRAPPSTDLYTSEGLSESDSDFGYHHDLKPANVLIFSKSKGDVWKIGDFGNARIYRAVKGQSQRTRNFTMGDAVYEPPDWQRYHETSRPYDIWSLGCIYLEVLVWLFWSMPGEGLSEFEARRSRDDGQQGYPAFWLFKPEDSTVELRPAVLEVMRTLEQRTPGFFRQIVSITNRMLNLEPLERPQASWVRSSLKAARIQANIELANLEDDQTFVDDNYLTRLPHTQQVAAPVTLPHARRGSIDERSIASRRDSTPRPGSSLSNAERSPTSETRTVDDQLTGLGQQHVLKPSITLLKPPNSRSQSPQSRRQSRGQQSRLSPSPRQSVSQGSPPALSLGET